MQKQQTTLFKLQCHQTEVSNNDEDSSGDDPDDLSGSESRLSSSSELLMTEVTNTSVPADIAQSKHHSPIQPILQNYPRTIFEMAKVPETVASVITGILNFLSLNTLFQKMLCFAMPAAYFPTPQLL